MFGKVEHIGIAVSNLADSEKLFESLLGRPPYKRESVDAEQVSTSFFLSGNNKIELLESTNPDGPIGKFIAARGPGLHHIAFDVADIRKEMARLKSEGFQLLRDEPFKGADNKWVCFVHPKSANGILVELCQEISEDGA